MYVHCTVHCMRMGRWGDGEMPRRGVGIGKSKVESRKLQEAQMTVVSHHGACSEPSGSLPVCLLLFVLSCVALPFSILRSKKEEGKKEPKK